ncbi:MULTISPECIES: hypothetical protein [unclassified Acidovorax]|uniref:hypothetical protein n=1 Tax=unclassified Acidovorax TaxID=2684926 RepID=UPI002882DA51|nr:MULTISPECIES: hypothetical protein [unclassified Acidovorax]
MNGPSDSLVLPAAHGAGGLPHRSNDDALSLDRSVAGEEDPGASLDELTHVPPPAPGRAAPTPSSACVKDAPSSPAPGSAAR